MFRAALEEVGRHEFESSCLPSCYQIIGSYSCQANTCSFTLEKKRGKSEKRIYFGTQKKYKTELLQYNIRWGKKPHYF